MMCDFFPLFYIFMSLKFCTARMYYFYRRKNISQLRWKVGRKKMNVFRNKPHIGMLKKKRKFRWDILLVLMHKKKTAFFFLHDNNMYLTRLLQWSQSDDTLRMLHSVLQVLFLTFIIYLAVGLSSGTWDLQSHLLLVGSLAAACKLLVVAYGI